MTKQIEPCDIGRHPELIKKAQSEMTETDVLVCGRCHKVFHFVEAFQEHKEETCVPDSTLKDCRETKPKVWAFLLWKAAQLANAENTVVNSWKLYKTWIGLEDAIRETWVVAGHTIQSFAKMGQGSLQEMPVKITKTMIDSSPEPSPPRELRRGPAAAKPTAAAVAAASTGGATATTKREPVTIAKMMPKASPNKVYKAKHIDADTNDVAEYRVEKILAKRFNPRRKMHEYLVKWHVAEPLDNNTWEPQTHLETCVPLLEVFEVQLAKQKEARAKSQQAAFDQLKGIKPTTPGAAAATTPAKMATPLMLRPQRSSAVKALTAVRRWASSDEEGQGLKRKGGDHDFEDASDDDDVDFPSPTKQKRLEVTQSRPTGVRAGVGGGTQVAIVRKPVPMNGTRSPSAAAEVILASPKDGKRSGVVRKPGVAGGISPKSEAQIRVIGKGESVPSGVVRIVQNSAGKVVRSTVQQVIGSKQQQTPRPIINTRPAVGRPPTQPPQQRIIQKTQTSVVKKPLEPAASRTVVTRIIKGSGGGGGQSPHVETKRAEAAAEEEEDDGLPDLFPDEITQPAPDSPDRPLTLCPLTGKVLGRAEGEKTPPAEEERDAPVQDKAIASTSKEADTQIQQLLTNEDGTPLLVTGEDGTIYQVAGKNAEGQTVLIAQGADGEQQCLLIAGDDESGLLQMNAGAAGEGAVAAQGEGAEQQPTEGAQVQASQPLTIQTGDGEGDGQITAEVVQADLPSPGGTRRVVLLLPDGTFMMTEVNDEQYQSLNLVN